MGLINQLIDDAHTHTHIYIYILNTYVYKHVLMHNQLVTQSTESYHWGEHCR